METNDPRVTEVRKTESLVFATVKKVSKLAKQYGTCIGPGHYMFIPEHFDAFLHELRETKR